MSEKLHALKGSKGFLAQIYIGVALLALTFASLQALARVDQQSAVVTTPLKEFPLALNQWQGLESDIDDGIIDVLGLEDWLMRLYQKNTGESIWLYVGYLGPWDVGKKRQAYHSPQFCYPAQGWDIVENELQDISVGDGRQIRVNKLLVQNGLQRQLVLYWFQHGDEIAPESKGADFKAKLAWIVKLPWMVLSNERTDRALVRFSSAVVGDADEALARQIEFIQAAFPALENHFDLDLASS